jgi:hypothetical protein
MPRRVSKSLIRGQHRQVRIRVGADPFRAVPFCALKACLVLCFQANFLMKNYQDHQTSYNLILPNLTLIDQISTSQFR